MPTEAEVLAALELLSDLASDRSFTLSADARQGFSTASNNLSWLLRQADFRAACRPVNRGDENVADSPDCEHINQKFHGDCSSCTDCRAPLD